MHDCRVVDWSRGWSTGVESGGLEWRVKYRSGRWWIGVEGFKLRSGGGWIGVEG